MARARSRIPLNVFLNGQLVGQLRRQASGAIEFQYDKDWLSWENALPAVKAQRGGRSRLHGYAHYLPPVRCGCEPSDAGGDTHRRPFPVPSLIGQKPGLQKPSRGDCLNGRSVYAKSGGEQGRRSP